MKIILSCTTTNERSNIFYYCLQSILKQNTQPDLILINISKKPYLKDSGFSELPDWMKDERLTINWVDNIGSYRKLLPALEIADDNDLVITCDDDVIYHQYWLSSLIATNKKNPNCVIAGRVRLVKKNLLGNYLNYSKWGLKNDEIESLNLLPIGIDGVLYKKQYLDLNLLYDKSFLEIAPKSDDLWFKASSLIKGTNVFFNPTIANGNVYLLHNMGLQEDNFTKRSRTSNYIKKVIIDIIIHIKDYLGINTSNNDFAWDNIMNYLTTSFQRNEEKI